MKGGEIYHEQKRDYNNQINSHISVGAIVHSIDEHTIFFHHLPML